MIWSAIECISELTDDRQEEVCECLHLLPKIKERRGNISRGIITGGKKAGKACKDFFIIGFVTEQCNSGYPATYIEYVRKVPIPAIYFNTKKGAPKGSSTYAFNVDIIIADATTTSFSVVVENFGTIKFKSRSSLTWMTCRSTTRYIQEMVKEHTCVRSNSPICLVNHPKSAVCLVPVSASTTNTFFPS